MTFIAGAGIFGFLVFVTRMIHFKIKKFDGLAKKSAFLALFVDHGMGYRPLWIVNAILLAILCDSFLCNPGEKRKIIEIQEIG